MMWFDEVIAKIEGCERADGGIKKDKTAQS